MRANVEDMKFSKMCAFQVLDILWIFGLCHSCYFNHAVLDESDGAGDSWTFFPLF